MDSVNDENGESARLLKTESSKESDAKSKDASNKNRKLATKEVSIWKYTTARQKLLLFDILLTDFFLYFSTSTPNAFFSRVVLEKGGEIFYSAIILQTLMISIAIFSIVFGKFQAKIGCKNLYIAGVGVFGICQVSFGCLQYVKDIKLFTALGVMIRFLAGVADAAYTVSSITIACDQFPKYISLVIGLMEAAVGTAMFLGPLFGGVLYDVVGMSLPVCITGGLLISTIPIHYIIFPKESIGEEERKNAFSMIQLLKNPAAVISLLAFGFSLGIFGYYEIALTTYLKGMDFSTSEVGVVMFLDGLAYAVFAALTGYVIGLRQWLKKAAVVAGTICYASTFFFFGTKRQKYVIYLGGFCFGATVATATMPTMEILIIIANGGKSSSESSTEIYSNISGMWMTAFSLGTVTIPVLSSAVQQVTKSFSKDMTYLAILEYILAAVLCIIFVATRSKH